MRKQGALFSENLSFKNIHLKDIKIVHNIYFLLSTNPIKGQNQLVRIN